MARKNFSLLQKETEWQATFLLRWRENCFAPLMIHCWSTSCSPWKQKKNKRVKNAFDPWYAILSFWIFFLQVLDIFCRSKKNYSWNGQKKFCCAKKMGKFWNFFKCKQRWHSDGRLCLDLENLKNVPRFFFAQNFFHDILRRTFLGSTEKFHHL